MMGGYENLGPIVSQNPQAVTPGGGSFSATERSYDSLVFQQNHPPMDWEMNLLQSVIGNSGLRNFASTSYVSSFLSGSNVVADSYNFINPIVGNENKLQVKTCDAIVNGWNIRLQYSEDGDVDYNTIIFPSPPASGGRSDLLILEVWRALLSPSPSTDNKSPAGQILRNGNAKAPDAAPNVNLADDLLDPIYLSESAKRVQVQYRLRVVSGVDVIGYPDGLGDPTVTAHTVPYLSGSTVDGNDIPTLPYVGVDEDAGLWRAGSGDAISAAAIGSVDGYIYAIPVCVVARRNSSNYDRLTNENGAPTIAGVGNDRPDGLKCDQIVEGDLVDLRRFMAWEMSELRDQAINDLTVNSLATQFEVTGVDTAGSTFTYRDSTGPAGHLKSTDGVRTAFSDRTTDQMIVLTTPLAVSASTFSLDIIGAVNFPWGAGNILLNAPPGTSLLRVSRLYLDDGAGNVYDLFDPANAFSVDSISYSVANIAGVACSGMVPVGTLYWEVIISYPPNCGVSRNMVNGVEAWVPAPVPAWVDNSLLLATYDPNRVSNSTTYFSNLNREVVTSLVTNYITDTYYSITTNTIMIPESVLPPSISLGGGLVVTSIDQNRGVTVVEFNPPVASPGMAVTATYRASRPLAAMGVGDSLDVFYETRAIQTVPVPVAAGTVSLIKKNAFDRMFFISSGAGSNGTTGVGTTGGPDSSSQFPFVGASALPANSDSLFFGYHHSSTILNTNYSGMSKIPVTVDEIPNRFEVTVDPALNQDYDGRYFFKTMNSPSNGSISGVDLAPTSVVTRRKIISDCVVELPSDYAGFGRKGTLFLAVFSGCRYGESENTTDFGSGNGGISLYRLNGNPVYHRRSR